MVEFRKCWPNFLSILRKLGPRCIASRGASYERTELGVTVLFLTIYPLIFCCRTVRKMRATVETKRTVREVFEPERYLSLSATAIEILLHRMKYGTVNGSLKFYFQDGASILASFHREPMQHRKSTSSKSNLRNLSRKLRKLRETKEPFFLEIKRKREFRVTMRVQLLPSNESRTATTRILRQKLHVGLYERTFRIKRSERKCQIEILN